MSSLGPSHTLTWPSQPDICRSVLYHHHKPLYGFTVRTPSWY
jgi:hypothetical protein